MTQQMTVELFMKNIIKEAREFSIVNHKEQKYNCAEGEKPYVYHLDAVYKITVEFGLDYKYQIAAYLHDILEDTTVTKTMLKDAFGHWVANVVDSVSGFGENRKEKKKVMIDKLTNFIDGVDLKMCDRLANMRQCAIDKNEKKLNMYIKELNDYDDLFKLGNKELYKELQKFTTIEIIAAPKVKL